MSTPDKAIEAAGRVFYASQTGGDNLDTSVYRQAWLNIAERAVEAATPFIAARALHEHAETWGNTRDEFNRPVAFHVHLDARKYQEDRL